VTTAPEAFNESLPVPLAVSLVAAVVAATFGVAVGAAFGWLPGVVTGVVVVGLVGWLLHRATGHVVVTGDELRAGAARLPRWAWGDAVPLDAIAARRLRGVDADPRAFLYLRGWVPTAVRLDLNDPSDPAPYWYVSTRHPEALAEALGWTKPGAGDATESGRA
jgi:hypothetical protein